MQSPELGNALTTFFTVFPAELPDKTMIATLVLTSRFGRPRAVWSGVAAAFAVHVGVAVSAGTLLARLPSSWVSVAAALLFAVGAVVLWREANQPVDAAVDTAAAPVSGASTRRIVTTAFLTVVVAEWGDLTQLATAGLAAKLHDPVAVGVGSLLALWAVAAIAATAGRTLLRVAPLHQVQRIAAILFGALAAWTVIELLR